jgi:hypothetical protein
VVFAWWYSNAGDIILGETKSKAAKAAKDSIPWAAVVVAILGWYDARETGQDASSKAVAVAEVAKVESSAISETRLKNAYSEIQSAFAAHEIEMSRHLQRIDDLEGWVVELEEWVEDEIESDSPRTRADREDREERLTAIRDNKTKRRRERASKAFHKKLPPAMMQDYDQVQTQARLDPDPHSE